jgi:hypothetical protein
MIVILHKVGSLFYLMKDQAIFKICLNIYKKQIMIPSFMSITVGVVDDEWWIEKDKEESSYSLFSDTN